MAFTTKDVDAIEKALAKAHPDQTWVVSPFDEGNGVAVELDGARWQITDPDAKNADVVEAASAWLLSRPKADM